MIRYTRKEELWNTWSHAGGILMGVLVGIVFVRIAFSGNDPWARLGVCLYLFGMLGSYIASTAYHALPHRSPWKERLRRWDHAAIYWHIAGSYSPLTLIAMRGEGVWGWGLFAFVWLSALAGTIVSLLRLKEHSHVETVCFVLMGLSVLVAFKPLLATVSTAAVAYCGRGRLLHHRCTVLFAQRPTLHAQRVPLLRPGRKHLPHHRRLGRPHAVFVAFLRLPPPYNKAYHQLIVNFQKLVI